MEYWHNLITEKSFQALKELKRKYQFILIGGWAVFLHTHALKSKDIDIIVDYDQLNKLKQEFEISKNARLKKYEIKSGDFDVDIYLPHFSNPGLPAEVLEKFTVSKEGFQIISPEALLVLKQTAYQQRRGSPRGKKDEIDIFSLLMLSDFDWKKYQKIIKEYNLEKLKQELMALLGEVFEVKELKLSRHKISKLKQKILKESK